MTVTLIQPSFARGEISPRLQARVDIEYYKTALAYCSNFFVLRQGGLRRRSGTRHIASTKFGDRHVVIRPFAFTAADIPQVYALEFGDLYVRFHTANGTVTNADGTPYEVATPWSKDIIGDLQIKQINDELLITHRLVPPYTLRRYGELDWRVLPVIFEDGPFQEIIKDGTILQPSSNGGIIQGVVGQNTPGLGKAFASSYDLNFPDWQAFDGNGNTEWMAYHTDQGEYVGFFFEKPKIVTGYVVGSSPRVDNYSEYTGSSQTIYKIPGSLRAPRAWVFEGHPEQAGFSFSSVSGTGPAGNLDSQKGWVVLDQQAEVTGWGDGERRYFTFNNITPYKAYRLRVVEINASVTIARPVSIGTLKFSTGGADIGVLTLTVSKTDSINRGRGFQPNDAGRQIRMLSEDAYWHWFRILGVTSEVSCDVEMHSPPLPSTNGAATFRMGAFGDVPGWPARVAGFQNRVFYAGTNEQPQTVWGSKVDDYSNFTTSIPSKADDSLDFTIAESGQIQWLLESSDLLIGTVTATRSLGAANQGEGFSATNFKQGKPIRTGSQDTPPSNAGVASLFVGRLGTTLHELTYDFTIDGLIAPDAAVLSEHLLRQGVSEIAFSFQPNALVWITMRDGSLVAMTYEREQKMVALTRQQIGGNAFVESVCVLPGTDRDETWFVMSRDGVRTIELLTADFEGQAQAEGFFVDGGVTYRGAPATIISGLPALMIGRQVAILSDGAPEPGLAIVDSDGVGGGKVTLPSGTPGSIIHIGLPYQSKATTLRIPQGGNDGSGLGRKKVLKKIIVDMLETGDLKCQAVNTNSDPEQMILRGTDDTMGDPVPLFTGSASVRVSDRWSNGGQLTLTVDDPLPATILAVSPSFESEP